MTAQTLWLDFDGVICDVLTPWVAAYNRAANDCLRVDDVTEYKWSVHTKWSMRELDALRVSANLYEVAHPTLGAVSTLHSLNRIGVPMQVITNDHDCLYDVKREWLARHCGGLHLPLVGLPIGEPKLPYIANGILVDDYSGNTPHLLYDQPYNRDYEYSLRMYGWADVGLYVRGWFVQQAKMD